VSLHPRIQKTIALVASFIFPSHQNVQDEPFSLKNHGICFWDRKGFLLVDFMPKRTTINVEAYCNTLKKLRRAIQNSRRGMLTGGGVSLLDDNARPHTAAVSEELLTSFGWDIVTHPPYSPDLAPSDYHFFTKLKEFLGGKRFSNNQEVEEVAERAGGGGL
jgi:histone-lysine N-methyltransferase SETMAR